MNPIVRRSLWTTVATIALVFVAIALGILPVRANFLKALVVETVRDTAGLELSIGGPVKVRLGLTPAVTSSEIALASPGAERLLEVDSLHARISLIALFRGRIHVRGFESDGIRVDYCAPLADLPETTSEDSEPPSIAVDGITLTNVSVRCGPPLENDPLAIDVSTLSAAAPLDSPMLFHADGSVATLELDLSATGGNLNELLAGPAQFPVSAKLESVDALIKFDGNLQLSPGEPIAEALLETEVRDLQPIASAFDVELPELGELNMRGNLRLEQSIVELRGLSGSLGNSDFTVDASINVAGERPHVTLAATSNRVDVEPLLAGGSDPTGSSAGASSPDLDFEPLFDALGIIDANVDVAVSEVLGLPIDVTSIELDAELLDGAAELHSLDAELLGTRWSANGGLNSRSECPDLRLLAIGDGLELAELNSLLATDRTLGGRSGAVTLETSSCGSSLFAHRDTLRANLGVAGIEASLDGDALPLALTDLTASVAPGERVRAALVGRLLDERLEATLAVGILEELLGTEPWPVDVDVRGGGGRLLVDGRTRLGPDDMVVDARVRFNAASVGSLHSWAPFSPTANLPLSAATKLRFDDTEIVADNIAISLGNTDLGGRISWGYAKDPDLLSVTVRSESVDVAELVSALPSEPEDPEPVEQADSDETTRELVLPPVDLDLEIDAIHADRLDIQNLSVGARLRKGLIDEARVRLTVENEVQLDGRLDLDARQLPTRGKIEFKADNLDVGRVLRRMEAVDDLQMRADTLDLLVTMQGATPRQFVLNTLLQVDLYGFDWKITKPNSQDHSVTDREFDVKLEKVHLTTAPNQPTTWVSRGRINSTDAELFVRAPSLNDIFGELATLPFTLIVAADSDVAMIDTRIDRSTEDSLLAQVMISGQVIPGDDRKLEELVSPLEDYQLQSDVVLRANQLQLSDVQMRLGSSSAQGRFDIDTSGSRTRFDAELHAPYLQTDDLLYWSTGFREDLANNDERAGDEASPDADEADEPTDSAENRGVLFLASDFITEFREENDLAVSITVDELRSGPTLLGGGEIQLLANEDEFRLAPVTFRLPGGGIDAEYWARSENGRVDAGLRVSADAFSYGGLLRLADHESEAAGLLFLDTEILANFELRPDAMPLDLLFENANGAISIAAWPKNFEAGVLDLWTGNLILAVLPTPETGEVSRLNCLVSRFDIENGLMKSRTTLLDTTETVIRGRGTIDLSDEQLDLLIWPQAKREKFFSVSTPVAITGSFDDFEIGVAPAGFLGTLIKWYTALIYVPYKWLTGERFPPDGTSTCFDAMDWKLTPELQEYFLQRDFSTPPVFE